jgi:DNA-binding transcriptional regulator LsrR (DeoR family)
MVRDALLADPQISSTLSLAAKADVALVGIGRPIPDSAVMQAGILAQEEFEQLLTQGAVGDIALRFFDLDGRQVEHEINDRIIGLELEQIRRIPRVIGVAGGGEKYEVIRAALRGSMVNVLVTDDWTATKLIEDAEPAGASGAGEGLPCGEVQGPRRGHKARQAQDGRSVPPVGSRSAGNSRTVPGREP